MKKTLFIILTLITLCLILCSCSKPKDNLSQYMPQKIEKESIIKPRDENAKGSRTNPFKLSDEIIFSSVDINLENVYKTTLEINKLSDQEEKNAKNIYKNKHGYVCGEAYSIVFEIETITGNNNKTISDRTDSGGCFVKHGYDENMKEVHFDCFDKTDGEKIYDFFPDTKYDLYMEINETIKCKFITLEYRIDEYKTETIWVDVT